MASWGNDPSSVTNKPKFLLDNEVTKYRREDSYASIQGWVMRAGSPATGNGNINASPEMLVLNKNCILIFQKVEVLYLTVQMVLPMQAMTFFWKQEMVLEHQILQMLGSLHLLQLVVQVKL